MKFYILNPQWVLAKSYVPGVWGANCTPTCFHNNSVVVSGAN